jgi:hypothetical protein
MTDEILTAIHKSIKWLDNHKTSNNITDLVIVIDDLTINAAYLGTLVTEAYQLMNETEDEYKIAVAAYVTAFDGSTAKAERHAEVEYQDQKRDWTAAKNGYKTLSMMLDRIDKICDAHRQRVSVMKGEIKHVV